MMIKLNERKIFTGSTMPLALAKFFFTTRMLVRKLFAVPNRLVRIDIEKHAAYIETVYFNCMRYE